MTAHESDQMDQTQAAFDSAETALLGIQAHIEAARIRLHQRALELATEFSERRILDGLGLFSGLNLMVRRRGNSVTAHWVMFHFRNSRRTGITNLPKQKGAPSYDLVTLKRHAPDWLLAAAIETEEAIRPIRESLSRLIEMDKSLRVISTRVGGSVFTALTPERIDADAGDEPDPTIPF